MSQVNENVVKLWCAGGAGLGIAADVLKSQGKLSTSTEIARLDTVLLDTSRSNYHKNESIFEEHGVELVTIPGLDGSGQKRDENVDKVVPYIANIVHQHKPEDNSSLNIVIHSGSGGSGSIEGPLVVKELLENDAVVMVIMIGDATTNKFAANTAATIRTYASISKQLGKPVIVRYYQNYADKDSTPDNINKAIAYSITDYRLLFSGNIHGVDSSDLRHFFQYHKVTNTEPGLTLISNFAIQNQDKSSLDKTLEKSLGDNYNIVSLISIDSGDGLSRQPIPCDFRVDGQVIYASNVPEEKRSSLYFVLTDNYFFQVINSLNEVVSSYEKKARARVNNVINTSDADSNGLVL